MVDLALGKKVMISCCYMPDHEFMRTIFGYIIGMTFLQTRSISLRLEYHPFEADDAEQTLIHGTRE